MTRISGSSIQNSSTYFPEKVLQGIFSSLTTKDLITCTLVCKQWKKVIDDYDICWEGAYSTKYIFLDKKLKERQIKKKNSKERKLMTTDIKSYKNAFAYLQCCDFITFRKSSKQFKGIRCFTCDSTKHDICSTKYENEFTSGIDYSITQEYYVFKPAEMNVKTDYVKIAQILHTKKYISNSALSNWGPNFYVNLHKNKKIPMATKVFMGVFHFTLSPIIIPAAGIYDLCNSHRTESNCDCNNCTKHRFKAIESISEKECIDWDKKYHYKARDDFPRND